MINVNIPFQSFTHKEPPGIMNHVGVNVAADPLFTLSYTGTEGGLVIVSADDPWPQRAGVPARMSALARATKYD